MLASTCVGGWHGQAMRMGAGTLVPKVSVLAAAALALAGCGDSHRHLAARSEVVVTATSTLFDQPVHIVVSGVRAHRTVMVAIRSVDSRGVAFSANAAFRSSPAGIVDLATAPATSGAYRGVDPMGLIDSMSPAAGSSDPCRWTDGTPQGFEVTVSDGGSRLASRIFTRRLSAAGVSVHDESIAATGFYGQFWAPAARSARRPGVLEFGGSEGGLHGRLIGAALACGISDARPRVFRRAWLALCVARHPSRVLRRGAAVVGSPTGGAHG
jgi:Acyl-CoA thioester hydrolase/BAAT N-terminal region